MNKSCRYCGRTHPIGERCALAPKKWERTRRGSSAARSFRSTNAWTQKAIHIKQRDRYLCRVCLAEGKLTVDGLEAHHIVPIEEDYDLRLDDDNLITLCSGHHKQADSGQIPREALRALIPH